MPKRRLKIPLQKLIKRKNKRTPTKQVEYLLEQTDLASLQKAKAAKHLSVKDLIMVTK